MIQYHDSRYFIKKLTVRDSLEIEKQGDNLPAGLLVGIVDEQGKRVFTKESVLDVDLVEAKRLYKALLDYNDSTVEDAKKN